MIIKIPQSNISERTYIIDILIGEFLGLSYSVEVSDTTNYHLIFDENEVIIEDHFFSQYQEDLSYLGIEAIPKAVIYAQNQFTSEADVPVLYGNDKMVVEESRIIFGNDIFAASFFMLTRWEEYVNPARDIHNRFSARDSISYKFDFLDRPIVNEYVEMLWAMLVHLEYKEERKKQEYEFVLTHDVDVLRSYKGKNALMRRVIGDLYLRKSPIKAIKSIEEYIQIKRKKILDPYDTFSWLMDLSEEANLKSRFYFMSGGITSYDNRYNINEPVALKIIEEIKKREHIIGFHPSYDAYNNPIQWNKEKDKLEKTVNQKVTEGRQHFLRFEAPLTWQIWNDNQMDRDLSLSYADMEGFRSGVCYEYSVFNFLQREKLRLKEMPMIVMEGSFTKYQDISPEQMTEEILILLKIVKKYNGKFVFLWHNSSFNVATWFQYKQVYEKVIQQA